MPTLVIEDYVAFRSIGMPEGKALKAAVAMASVRCKVERLDGKVNLLHTLVSLNIGISIAIAPKLFIH